MIALVQSQSETGEFPLIQKNRAPYSLERVSEDVLGFTNYPHRANWFDPDIQDDHGRALDMVITMFGDIAVFNFVDQHYSEESDVTLSYAVDMHVPADYPNDSWMMANALLQAEAWKKSLEITKVKIKSIFEQINPDETYYLRDGTTLRIGKVRSSKPEWVQEIEGLGTSRPDARQLAKLIKTLKSLSNEGKFDQIDTALGTARISSLSLEILIGFLRSTYHCRDRLKNWSAFLNTARTEIRSRGLDAKEAFVGLY